MRIIKGVLGIEDFQFNSNPKTIIGRYDMLGRKITETYKGIQILMYDDGSFKKIHTVKN